jgi:pyrimidine operon attenuation protein/uracil phosphoribosyltransferase
MNPSNTTALEMPSAQALYERLRDGVAALIAGLARDQVHLVGIHSGGAWLAQRLQQDLGLTTEMGTLDISFYRDDFDRIGLHAQVQPSDISFPVAERHLILVDDVLFTGRTIRAAMNELFDYGRPASIKLVVLIDRGGRQLPVCADFAAWQTSDPSVGSFVLARSDTGEFSLHVETETP